MRAHTSAASLRRGSRTHRVERCRVSGRRRATRWRFLEPLEERVVLAGASPLSLELNSLIVDTNHYDPDRVIVNFAPGVDIQTVADAFDGAIGNARRLFGELWELDLAASTSVENALSTLRASPLVAFAEPDYTLRIAATPDDPQFSSLWGLHNTGQTGGTADADIDALEAWSVTTGNPSIIVAVIDTGVDYRHADLAANMWINPGEIPGDQVDNDGNGFVDDVHGYDFINDDASPLDDHGHGTHVAGTIGAVGNNGAGVVGINWDVQIMALKFLGADGSGSTSDAIRALNYAVQMGAQVSNNSYGDSQFSQAFQSAIQSAAQANHVFVAAAGNSGTNNDTSPFFPAAYDAANLISVAATDHRDQRASFSNYGVMTVDLAAPGVNVLSTTPNNGYGNNSGTSMAAPHVAGVVSLVRGLHPEWSYQQVVDQVLGSVDFVPALESRVVTGGRLNAARAVGVPDSDGPRIIAADPSGAASGPINTVRLTFDEPMDPASFTPSDVVSFVGPGGEIAITGVAAVSGANNRKFELSFAPQSAKGTYTVTVGPDILDVAGNPMNQDADAANGEVPDDRYTSSFEIGDIHVLPSNDVPLALGMFSTVTSTLMVNQELNIADLDVQVNISYPDSGLLGLTLISPAGTRVTLASSRGFLGPDFVDTVFDDEAALALADGAPPYDGSYRPDSALSVFDNTSALGVWKLEVSAPWFHTGTVNAWSLLVVAQPPRISVNDVSVREGDAGTTIADFTVSLSNTSGDAVSVDYATEDGTAAAPGDYAAASGTLVFAPGEQSKTVSVVVQGDVLDEPDEHFVLNLNSAVNATLGDAQGLGTIVNDEARLTVNDLALVEGDSGIAHGTFTVSLSAVSNQTVTVTYATADGTATAGSDYAAASGTLTFAPGETVKTIAVAVNGDARNEDHETFFVYLFGAANAVIDREQGVGLIQNDDPIPSLWITDSSTTEGHAGTKNLSFLVRLSAVSGRTVSVNYATLAGTATSGDDFIASEGTIELSPGQTSKTVSVVIVGDTVAEPDETFVMSLSNATGAVLLDGEATGIIENDDTTISIDDLLMHEGDGGFSEAAFTASLSSAVDFEVRATYTTANNTAAAGSDYLFSKGEVVFAPGEVSRTISIVVLHDVRNEDEERFFVNLSNPVGALLADSQGAATIVDNDPTPNVLVADASISEGDAGTKNLSFTVSLSEASGKTVSVPYATANGSAIAGVDYAAKSGTLTFLPGVISQTVQVAVSGDTAAEVDKAFRLTLGNPTNAGLSDGEAEGTILDDDNLSIGDTVLVEGDSGATYAEFTVQLAVPLAQEVRVDYATANATAVAGSDYVATSGTLVLPPGQTTYTIAVPVIGDLRDELDETFFLNLSNPLNVLLGDAQGTAAIVNDDPVPEVSVNDAVIVEGDSGTRSLSFTVSLSEVSGRTVTVEYATADDTATAGSDYVARSASLNLLAGQISQRILITVNGDTDEEANEAMLLSIFNATNATIDDGQATGTIAGDDPLPAMSIADAKVVEGATGTKNLNFFVSLSRASTTTVSVGYATLSGTATAGSDFTDSQGVLTFAPGQVNKPVSIPIKGDTLLEPDESFVVRLSDAIGAVIFDADGEGTIQNDDVNLRIGDTSVSEGDSGIASATFSVTLSAPADFAVQVDYTTVNNTATAGSDFLASNGAVVFGPGETTKSVDIVLLNDIRNEVNERFFVNLSNPVGALVADSQGAATIVDNDPTPNVLVADASISEGDAGTKNLSFTVSLSEASGKTVSVPYATANGSAIAGVDYAAKSGTLTFLPGVLSQIVQVAISGDTTPEADKWLRLTLGNPTNASLSDSEAEGTILDDDNLTIGDTVLVEGDSGATYAEFTVQLAVPLAQEVRVDYATANATAVAGSDYVATSGTLVLPPGQTTYTIAVPVIGDLRDELDETFSLSLSNPLNVLLGDSQGTATIVNDDPVPAVSASDAVIVEGDSGTRSLSFTVSLSEVSGRTVTVEYATADDTATAGSDYVARSGSLTFLPGAIAHTLAITVSGDTVLESDEGLQLALLAATNAVIDDGQGFGTILNDDAGTSSVQTAPAIGGGTGRVMKPISNAMRSALVAAIFEHLGAPEIERPGLTAKGRVRWMTSIVD